MKPTQKHLEELGLVQCTPHATNGGLHRSGRVSTDLGPEVLFKKLIWLCSPVAVTTPPADVVVATPLDAIVAQAVAYPLLLPVAVATDYQKVTASGLVAGRVTLRHGERDIAEVQCGPDDTLIVGRQNGFSFDHPFFALVRGKQRRVIVVTTVLKVEHVERLIAAVERTEATVAGVVAVVNPRPGDPALARIAPPLRALVTVPLGPWSEVECREFGPCRTEEGGLAEAQA